MMVTSGSPGITPTQRSLSPRSPSTDKELPEDDGMGALRKRILEINKLDVASAEKSRLMHAAMTEQYSFQHASNISFSPSSSQRSQDRPFTPPSSQSNDASMTDSPDTAVSNDEYLYATEEEKRASYHPIGQPSGSKAGCHEHQDRQFGCSHYMRNVKLQCSACRRWYPCRFCHDQVEDHCLDRPKTRNMLCMDCGFAQSAAQECRNCGQLAAWYYCKICKLWDDDPTKSIYHCNDCGICRRGQGLGKDYFHCKTCRACISMQIRDTHKCIERSTDCDCPICGEYLFSSPKTVVFMRCGHSIHHACWKQHMQRSFKCPICSKSMINMEITFRQFDLDIAAQPMPAQFRDTKAWIFCNDCSAKSLVPYHWIGLKCTVCDSYNTARLQMITGHDVATIDREHTGVAPSFPRGRSLLSNNMYRASSVPHTEVTRHGGQPLREAQSTSPTALRTSNFAPVNEDEDLGSMDISEEEVDFWGGEWSPSRRSEIVDSEFASVGQESSDDEDDCIDDDEDEEDQMEIFGHP